MAQEDEEHYGYVVFEGDGGKEYLYFRDFEDRLDYVAHLVRDLDPRSGEVLVRKVHHRLPSQQEPAEFRAMDAITALKEHNPKPEFPTYIAKWYPHRGEPVRAHKTSFGWPREYFALSYWKPYNGALLPKRWADFRNPNVPIPPIAAVARMMRQVLSIIHYLYTAAPQPLYHDALNMQNIWAHWEADSELPDFYLGDFGDARFANEWSPPSGSLKAIRPMSLRISVLGSTT
ncbi:hypothetical protein N656DRAFT_12586 [Canariomyces notabilis]|uniref:Protein kinase domain-containing protein n=1 Tax=Canariomyces notabilis TaxID=2074819 RepID=A0AAN6TMG6_9PEZI|nr:hypothetical protein N656DRAFT_12586 [Canariomyces arenarius]